MVNELEQLSKADYIHNIQNEARDYPVARFGRPQEIRGGNSRPVRSIAFSCDGRRVATGCDTRALRVWDAREKMDAATSFSLPASGEKSSPHGGHVTCLAWSPVQPNILVSGCKSSTTGTYAVVWDVTKPKAPVVALKLPFDILTISFHPNGSHFAVVCFRPSKSRDEVYFFNRVSVDGVEEWVQRADISIEGGGEDRGAEEINSLRFSNSGQYVCAVGNDGSLNAWYYPLSPVQSTPPAISSKRDREETEAGPSRPPTPKRRQASGVSSPAPADSADTADRNGDEGAEDVEMEDGANGTGGASTNPNDGESGASNQIPEKSAPPSPAASTLSATILPPTLSRPATPPPPSSDVKAVAAQQLRRIKHSIVLSAALLALGLDPTGKYMALGGQDALLSLFTTRDWICSRTYDISTGGIRYIAFSPDGEMIAFAGDEQAIFILVTKVSIPFTVNALAWHPTRNWLAYSVVSKGPVVWYMIQQE